MRLLLRFLFIFLAVETCAYGQTEPSVLNLKIKLRKNRATIGQFLEDIESSGILLTYSPQQIKLNKEVSLTSRHATTGQILQELFKDDDIEIKLLDHKILLVAKKRFSAIYGIVRQQYTGEVIADANVWIKDTKVRSTTNSYGFYSIDIEPGAYELYVSHIGSESKTFALQVDRSAFRKDVELGSADLTLATVEIKPDSATKNLAVKKPEQIDLVLTRQLPSAIGEKDIFGALQTLPGVVGATTNSVNLLVRGGTADQNLIIIDEVPVYNLNHFNGFFSIINSEILKSADFYSGNFPAKYTGRLSSVLDIRTREGNMSDFHGQTSVGFFHFSSTLEGPVIKNKSSFIVSMRRSWIDLLEKRSYEKFGQEVEYTNFTDLNIKTSYILNRNNRLYLTGYYGRDHYSRMFNIDQESVIEKTNWGNRLLAIRWNNILSPKLYQNTTFTASRYQNSLYTELDFNNLVPRMLISTITDYGIKTDFSFYLKQNLKINYGVGGNLNLFELPYLLSRTRALNTTAYIETETSIGQEIKLVTGVNYANTIVSGRIFHSLQPRVSVLKELGSKHSIIGSFAKMTQALHQITMFGIPSPYEIRIPSSSATPPEKSYIFSLTYRYAPAQGTNFAVQLYQKYAYHLLRLKPGQQMLFGFLAKDAFDRFLNGSGISKGIEFSYKKSYSWLDAQISYALASSRLKFNGLNSGNSFPADYNSKHTLSVVANTQITSKLSLSALFAFASGQQVTLPAILYKNLDETLGIESLEDNYSYRLKDINNYQLPNEYRLDVGAKYLKLLKKGRQRIFSVGANGLMSNLRPAYPYMSANTAIGRIQIEGLGKDGILPYFSFGYKF
ncbi:MAG: TonB-dependent receptor [Sphingobacteriaceae bacterium]|nr:TonB-dependent receptor [Sphingobacteriaceae bacterium]